MGGEGSVGGSGRWKRKRKGVRDGREGGENKIFLTHVWRMKAKCSDVVQLHRRGR